MLEGVGHVLPPLRAAPIPRCQSAQAVVEAVEHRRGKGQGLCCNCRGILEGECGCSENADPADDAGGADVDTPDLNDDGIGGGDEV